MGADFIELFLCGNDLGVAAVVEHQHVAGFEHDGLGQVDQHAVAMDEFDGAAADMAFVMGEHGKVERQLALRIGTDGFGANEMGSAQHR
ncbi:hypothetical protein GCM10010837_40420 [Aminobacter niigataensis]